MLSSWGNTSCRCFCWMRGLWWTRLNPTPSAASCFPEHWNRHAKPRCNQSGYIWQYICEGWMENSETYCIVFNFYALDPASPFISLFHPVAPCPLAVLHSFLFFIINVNQSSYHGAQLTINAYVMSSKLCFGGFCRKCKSQACSVLSPVSNS